MPRPDTARARRGRGHHAVRGLAGAGRGGCRRDRRRIRRRNAGGAVVIFAGLLLLAIGVADLLRQFVPARRRWVAYVVAVAALIAVSAGLDALPAAIAAALDRKSTRPNPSH